MLRTDYAILHVCQLRQMFDSSNFLAFSFCMSNIGCVLSGLKNSLVALNPSSVEASKFASFKKTGDGISHKRFTKKLN